ncbi:MAG TPA: c-type cytochrome [Vicinamibacteria bacterium]|nr:c-type cytochrome [Vicinamibacteria bacterium]
MGLSALGLAAALAALVLALPAPPARRGERAAGAVRAAGITPAERDRENPVRASPRALAAGRTLWRIHCETCHGTAGKGDGPNARLHERRRGHAPRDLTDPDLQENLTDGEIFWRLSNGIIEGENIIMPSFEKKISSETARWQLVIFVRELGRAR